jgi:pimeloyl-ACP methyl ester carboxylesterase
VHDREAAFATGGLGGGEWDGRRDAADRSVAATISPPAGDLRATSTAVRADRVLGRAGAGVVEASRRSRKAEVQGSSVQEAEVGLAGLQDRPAGREGARPRWRFLCRPDDPPPKNADERAALIAFRDNLKSYVDRWIANLKRAVPDARVVNVPGGGHFLFFTHEAKVLRQVRAFVTVVAEHERQRSRR